ncbi:hypothetical protein CDCA_CDCA16G4128 [Cyanidium caldarium]|uniref:Thioredoxin domain-containing protein n=1 Tax=Cyanidium caldarium TaxID=2771 RepID=A0AAV9J178_CYACA|nr:hypothetical protein CDCA_CDCA16G4128 [Cyanidium caldarium]
MQWSFRDTGSGGVVMDDDLGFTTVASLRFSSRGASPSRGRCSRHDKPRWRPRATPAAARWRMNDVPAPPPEDSHLRALGGVDDMRRVLTAHAAADQACIVLFKARWCRSCAQVYPHYARLAAEYHDSGHVACYHATFEDQKPLFRSLGITTLPLFQVYTPESGCVEEVTLGPQRLAQLRELFEQYARPAAERLRPRGDHK